jgi:hypothetical protein
MLNPIASITQLYAVVESEIPESDAISRQILDALLALKACLPLIVTSKFSNEGAKEVKILAGHMSAPLSTKTEVITMTDPKITLSHLGDENKVGSPQKPANHHKKPYYYCVKCGSHGTLVDYIPAPLDAKSRWKKFVQLIVCPSCGDDRGHCGLLECTKDFEEYYQSINAASTMISLSDISTPNLIGHEIVHSLPIEQAAAALQEFRGYERDLAIWLANRGIRFGSIAEVRFSGRISEETFEWLRENLDKNFASQLEKFFWLPIITYIAEKPFILGFQLRRVEGEPKYLTVRIAGKIPPAHIALPTDDRTDGQRWSGIWVTEGILKAEVIAYELGVVAVGALGTGALRQALPVVAETARRWHKDATLFSAPIILAPDADARTKLEVARAFWEVAKHLQREGFSVAFAIWSPKFKGIDDALIAGETPSVVAPEVWLATLQARIRNELLQVKVRPRLLLDGETAQAIELPESVAPSQSIVAQTYEVAKRKEAWLQALVSQQTSRKATVVVDSSPAGSGKTFAATKLKVTELRKAGLWVKRIVYIAPEVKRPAVPALERWRLYLGRDQLCPYWERLQVVEAEGLTKVGKQICAHCPVRKQCAYYAQKQSGGRRYWRISWQSYSPKEGDFLVLDEFSRLPLWRDFAITPDQLADFIATLDRFGAPEPLLEAFRALQKAISQSGSLSHNEVAQIFSAVQPEHWDAFSHDLLTLYADIRKVREWVFKQTDQRVTWLGWAQAIADIFRGNLVGQVWVEAGTPKVKILDAKLRDAVRKASAILVLDATVDPAEVERLLDAKVAVVKSDEPEKFPTVYQVPIGALSHRARPEAQKRWLWTAKQVIEALQRKGILPANAKVGVLTHKSAAEFAQQVFGKSAVVGWFGRDDRATNAYFEAGIQVLVVVGLPHRNIGSVAAERLKAGTRQRALRKAKLDAKGNWWTVLKEFADPELATAVRREAAIAYLQAAGRLRQGRRSEPCFMVVLDAEPLPEALNPIVIPPEKVLPPEVWQDWQRRRQRGAAVVNTLRQKAAAERLAKAAEAVRLYREMVGEDPKSAWLAQVLGVHRNWARKLLAEVTQTAHYICEKEIGNEDTDTETQMNCALCVTLEDAIRAFLSAGYPLPVRALARHFGICDAKVRRLARRLATELPSIATKLSEQPSEPSDQPATINTKEWLASFNAPELPTISEPICPACNELLEPEPDGTAVCVGCGRVWEVISVGQR